ncbi:Hypothetical protein PBC10988_11020 [Planctomycetales bacterium 10988]|nr:Hypothetical protein PBC10988_11020 [Planctomycetales bacterium 10988]
MIGPVFNREFLTAPRKTSLYITRAAYGAALLIIIATASMLVTGQKLLETVGETAQFHLLLFQFLAPVQLVLALLFSGLFVAASVAQEKDRRTLILLLMTRLTNAELVLGKLLASLLTVLVLLATALPIFAICALWGGVSFSQITRVFLITVTASLAAGSLGGLLAFWREKTFQALSMTMLSLVAYLILWEVVYFGFGSQVVAGGELYQWANLFSPLRALDAATIPTPEPASITAWLQHPAHGCALFSLGVVLVLNGISMLGVRAWNLTSDARRSAEERESQTALTTTQVTDQTTAITAAAESASPTESPAPPKTSLRSIFQEETHVEPTSDATKPASVSTKPSIHAAPGRQRHVWDQPILWRELRTWAYGKRILIVRAAFVLLSIACLGILIGAYQTNESLNADTVSTILSPLFVLSMVLVNAQAVTSFCSERDGKTLDLLLVSPLTEQEIVYGKIGGCFYNTWELWLVPMLFCLGLVFIQNEDALPILTWESLFYMVVGLAVLYLFVTVLGLHAGMTYDNSRLAISISLGTVIFLFVGIFTCIRMIITFAGSFELQLYPFLAFMLGGGVGLFAALGSRNPSPALLITSFLCPFATFYAISSFLLDQTLNVFLVSVFTYGFATVSMMIPALSSHDGTMGRTSGEEV